MPTSLQKGRGLYDSHHPVHLQKLHGRKKNIFLFKLCALIKIFTGAIPNRG